jgi:hypothetical protein
LVERFNESPGISDPGKLYPRGRVEDSNEDRRVPNQERKRVLERAHEDRNMGLRDEEITELTTLSVIVQVRNTDRSVKNLTGASFVARMGRDNTLLVGAAEVLNAAQGLVKVSFPAATGLEGHVVASLHMTVSGETQCVWRERFTVFTNVE